MTTKDIWLTLEDDKKVEKVAQAYHKGELEIGDPVEIE